MKKIAIILSFFLGISLNGISQEVGYGITIGGNISGIIETNEQLFLDSKMGFQVGAYVDYYFNQNVYLKGDLIFITKGAYSSAKATSWTESNISAEIYTDINPMYLQIPAIVGYYWDLKNGLGLNFELGGYFALGIAGKAVSRVTINETDIIDVNINYFKNSDKPNELYLGNNSRVDYGLRFGVGAMLNKHLSLAFHFDLGLHNIYNDKYVEKYYSKRNYSTLLTLGYRF
ncbi:MAG: PorT family protein [Bacteroidales bacterium]|nr:PorT family protein [Bacteroidales bacterium]